MVDRYVVGGFYRVHKGRGIDENLNALGMQFVPPAFEDTCLLRHREPRPGCGANLFYAYGVIARLALLAAVQELEKSPTPTSAIIEYAKQDKLPPPLLSSVEGLCDALVNTTLLWR